MRILNRLIVLLLTLSSLCAPTMGVADAGSIPAMTRAEITSEVIAKHLLYKGEEKGQALEGIIIYQSDRSIDIVTDGGLTDAGTWRFRRNKLCTRLSAFRARKETCFSIGRLAEGSFATSHGFRLTVAKSP